MAPTAKRKVAPAASHEDKAISHLPMVVSSEDDDKEFEKHVASKPNEPLGAASMPTPISFSRAKCIRTDKDLLTLFSSKTL